MKHHGEAIIIQSAFFFIFYHQYIISTLSLRPKKAINANRVGSASLILLGWSKFAGSLTAPTIESAKLEDGTAHRPWELFLEGKKQIKLCSSSSEKKGKQSPLCDRRQIGLRGEMSSGLFCHETQTASHFF